MKNETLSRMDAAMNAIADWGELQKYNGDLTRTDILEICNRADKVFNALAEDPTVGVKPDLSLYRDFLTIFAPNLFKLKVNTEYLLDACFKTPPENQSALKKIESRMETQIDYHERYYSSTKADVESELFSGTCLRLAAGVFSKDSETIEARNKTAVYNSRDVRRGVLDFKK